MTTSSSRPVVGPRLRRDLRAAAVLGEVGDGEEHRVGKAQRLRPVEQHLERLALVGKVLDRAGQEIRHDAADGRLLERAHQRRIPRQAAGDEEGPAVGRADVDLLAPRRSQRAGGLVQPQRDVKVPRKAVAAAGRQDAEGQRRAQQLRTDAVDHAIPPAISRVRVPLWRARSIWRRLSSGLALIWNVNSLPGRSQYLFTARVMAAADFPAQRER